MIFTGRLLANGDGVSLWQANQNSGVSLHFVKRGLVVDLSVAELGALAEATSAALAAVETPEDEKDHTRRLQILQARVSDLLRRERASRTGNAPPEDARGS
ncbi:MAG TPA: hypothetical protein VNL16_10025 [Chloroflexota bacterium]|nr:hypothetical protein [Chloroflexota bacterium]